MITPYIYRFTLGRNNPRTIDNKRIVYFDGKQMEIEHNNVEFRWEVKLTFDEFNKKIEGTQGITAIYGEFEDLDRKELVNFLTWILENYSNVNEKRIEEIVNAYIDAKMVTSLFN